jgi:large subunit ribosomal protein L29
MAKKLKGQADDYRSQNDEQLANTIADEEVRLQKTHFAHAVNPIENPLTIRAMRRRLAQLKTEQRKRQLGK